MPSITLGATYRLFGVVALPNQFINLSLHIVIVWLLYGMIRRAQPDRATALLLSGIVLCSPYTFSPATWVADRATLFVALALLILLRHILPGGEREQRLPSLSVLLVIATSSIALLSKESGLVVPTLALSAALQSSGPSGAKLRVIGACMVIIAVYVVVRFQAVQVNADFYVPSGYLWATQHYDNWVVLPPPLRIVASMENVLKNLIAPVLPIFGNEGNLLAPIDLVSTLLFWAPTLSLMILSVTRYLTRSQWYAMLLVVLNAVVHFAIFRYRVLYLAQIALCVFIAFSPQRHCCPTRVTFVKIIAIVLVGYSVFWVSRTLSWAALQRYDALRQLQTMAATGNYPSSLEQQVVDGIVWRYAPWLNPK